MNNMILDWLKMICTIVWTSVGILAGIALLIILVLILIGVFKNGTDRQRRADE